MRIVVADDDPDTAESLAMALEDLGHEVHVATSGENAIALCTSLQPDVALIDLRLPNVEGFTVAARGRGCFPRTALVAVTGLTSPAARERAFAVGFADFLCKPFGFEQLEQLLARHGPR